MDEIKFHCPNCMGSISAGPEWFGKSTGCPHCKRLIDIPFPQRTAPLVEQPLARPNPNPGPVANFVRKRKPFVVTVCVLLAAFLGLQIHLRTKPEPKPDHIATPVVSDDPFVLSNGYRLHQIYRTDADGKLHEFTDRESLEAWDRQQGASADHEAKGDFGKCSACNGTGRNRSTTVSKCPDCSGQGTRLTPSGHRVTCSACDGTGNARQNPACLYCGGTGRIR